MYWEDIDLGLRTDLGTHTFTEDEMIKFSLQFDPQPFHIDREAAKDSFYGGIIASGWHVASTWMKLMIAHSQRRAAEGIVSRGGVSPGFLDMRWHQPTRPGVTLHYASTVFEKVELKSRRDVGLIRSKNEAMNDAGEMVMSFTGQGFVQRRPQDA